VTSVRHCLRLCACVTFAVKSPIVYTTTAWQASLTYQTGM